jgi:riboflavin synthase
MFTGLIESVQPVKSNTATRLGRCLCVPLGPLAEDSLVGDSICVNGVCLTISKLDKRKSDAHFDVMRETVRASTLETLKPGEMVNLERALRADGRLGGHIVQGHVDGVGSIDRIEKSESKCVFRITAEPDLMRYIIEKGSIAVEGVSLTVVNVEPDRFSVWLIPTTLKETNLIHKKKGDRINLEADMIGKWIRKKLDEILPKNSTEAKLTLDKLREQGFAGRR